MSHRLLRHIRQAAMPATTSMQMVAPQAANAMRQASGSACGSPMSVHPRQPQEGRMSYEALLMVAALLAIDAVILWTGRKRNARARKRAR